MPVYGRYEPAEAMRDLGLSLGKIVTDMAETELQSRKMDLALKESDLKLGMLEKESQIGTLKTKLEGEARTVSLANEARRMSLSEQAEARMAEGQKEQLAISRGQLGVAQQKAAQEKQLFDMQMKPRTKGEMIETAYPHLAETIKKQLGDKAWNEKSTLAEYSPTIKSLADMFSGEKINILIHAGALKMRESEDRLKKLTPLVAMGNAQAIEEANQIVDSRTQQMRHLEMLSNTVKGASVDKIFHDLKKGNMDPNNQDVKTDVELMQMAVQLSRANQTETMRTVKGGMDIEDWLYKTGQKQDPMPYDRLLKEDVPEILKLKGEKRQEALDAKLNKLQENKDRGKITQSQYEKAKRIIIEAVTAAEQGKIKPKAVEKPKPEKRISPEEEETKRLLQSGGIPSPGKVAMKLRDAAVMTPEELEAEAEKARTRWSR